jgi:uncharacterized protein
MSAAMTERFEMRLDEETLANVDQWREQQDDTPSRAEAIRRLIEVGLTKVPGEDVKISDGERLLLIMMRDIYKHLKISDNKSEIDPDFVSSVLWGGHYWALKWQMPGLFHNHEDNNQTLSFVVDVLDLWDTLERSYEKLPKKEKERIEKEAAPFGKDVRFHGFDGNNEAEHIGIARFLVDKMDRFERFKSRGMNSHMPSVNTYKRMLEVYAPLSRNLSGGFLGANQLVAILQAMSHPERRK